MASKRRCFNILSCALIFLCGPSLFLSEALAANDCPPGIAGYWRLDETATGSYADAIGTNTGTCTGGGCPASEAGPVGQGKSFDGGDTITMSADTGGFNWSAGQSFTIELWMRRNTGAISGGLEAFIGRADAAGLNWYIGINASGNAQAMFHAADGSGPGELTVSKDLRSISTDVTWHHVALVHDASANENILYVDGQPSTPQNATYTAGFDSATAPMTLGALDGGNSFSNGALDEVAVYGQALDAKTIMSHYYISREYCGYFDTAVDVMPMGDSITTGIYGLDTDNPPELLPALEDRIGYRRDLSELLTNNFYLFDFIGSEQNGQNAVPSFDMDHAGFPGITDTQLLTLLDVGRNDVPDTPVEVTPGAYLETHPTEVVLLHIGTNGNELAGGESAADVGLVLDEIDQFSKNITVVLARIIDRAGTIPNVTAFNNNVDDLVDTRISQGDKIILVDMQNGAGIIYTSDQTTPFTDGDIYDDVHPNASGYSKIAGQWFATLETFMPNAEVPVITSTAVTDVVRGEAYSYTVTATGPPDPAFTLVSNPNGMSINATTGVIQWTTTTTAGDFNVTVRATNRAGQDDQSFTITVNALPVAVADAYNGINEGDTLSVVAANGVLQNDTDENDTLTAALVSTVSHGTLSLSPDGGFTYTHDDSENFTDSFTYKASDGKAESETVTVTFTITPVDDPINPDNPDNPGGGGGGGGGCFIRSIF